MPIDQLTAFLQSHIRPARSGRPHLPSAARVVACLLVLAGLLLNQAGAARPTRVVSAQAAAPGDDWPMYMHDPAHSGRTPASAFTGAPLYLQWAYAFGERVEVEAQPVLAAGILYQGVMNGEMHAIDARTGKKVWISQPGGPIAHTAAVAGGKVYFGSLDGCVYALSALDGAKAWSFCTAGPVVSAPLVVDGLLYIGSNDGSLYALDAASGTRRWSVATGGPVVSSPAFSGGRVYFGSEDLKARAVDSTTGKVAWETQLYGQGMHNTYPVISDDGKVVIFVTVKPGATSYVPIEGYPNAPLDANPVETWDNFYKTRPKFRTLYYLDAASGADLWQPGSLRYSPLPIPYWGLLEPVLAPDGTAWFPAPSGAAGFSNELDHDDRLFKIDLASGQTSAIAGGPGQPEFQTRVDEAGRHAFAGNDFLYTSSEDLSVYHPGADIRVLYGDGSPGQYDIGSHMNPLSPLPDRHLWRYGGAITMGGVPGSSVPVVANGLIYYSSYGWLYAVGQQNKGLNPATSFPKRDARAYELTYPRSIAPTTSAVRAEITRRVNDIIALGPDNPPMAVRWEQPSQRMLQNEFTFEVYGFDADLVRSLAETYPYLSAADQARLKTYLADFSKKTILNPDSYAYQTFCLEYGQAGIKSGDACNQGLAAIWNGQNPNLVAQRLYAIWAYASATGDWASVKAIWSSLILPQFKNFTSNYDPSLGFIRFEEWISGRLNIGAQIEAAQSVRDMAARLGDAAAQTNAQVLLDNLLDGRVKLANLVPQLYDAGKIQPAPLRLNPDGTLRYEDVIGPKSPYTNNLIPYTPELRDRNTDPSQVNWWDGQNFRVDAGTGFMYYQALVGYYPLTTSLTARLRSSLLAKTSYYVKSYEVNSPWWWMADLAHHTTGSGEHLYTSPTLSWTMFQVKARVLRLPFDSLAGELPEPVSFNARYDLYRLQNLTTLLQVCAWEGCSR